MIVQSDESRRGSDYEGLDRANMEPIQVPPPPHHYAGLGIQAPGAGLDQHGYPEYADYPQVSKGINEALYSCVDCPQSTDTDTVNNVPCVLTACRHGTTPVRTGRTWIY